MTTIKKTNILRQITNFLDLQTTAGDNPPDELGKTVVPTFSVNEKPKLIAFDFTSATFNQAFVVPQGKRWVIRNIFYSLVTSATVGSRVPIVDIDNENGLNLSRVTSETGTIVASTTERNTWAPNFGIFDSVAGTDFYMPLPLFDLNEGWTITLQDRNNIDAAGDLISGGVVINEYPSGENQGD